MEVDESLKFVDNLPLATDNNELELPLEVITHIMGFLNYSDRKCAGLVNHSWYEASLSSSFLNQDLVVFNQPILQDDAYPLSIIVNSNRPFHHFKFSEMELGAKVINFWKQAGSEIRSLKFYHCDMNEGYFSFILKFCPNLEELEVDFCNELLMSGRLLIDSDSQNSALKSLHKMKQLKILNNRYLSDALFNRFTSLAPNLETVSLAQCTIAFHPALFRRFYVESESQSTESCSEIILTYSNILKSLTDKIESINTLDFNFTLIDSPALTKLATLPQLNLEKLYLVCCDQLSNPGILSLTEHQKNLRVLDVSSCSRFTDQALIKICDSLSQLSELRMQKCLAITDLGVSNLSKLSQLETLDISQCKGVTSNGLTDAFCQKKNAVLKCLKLVALANLDYHTVIKLSEFLPNLIHLDLSYCFQAVTDLSVQAIIQHQIWLKVLNLSGCKEISDVGLLGLKFKPAEPKIDSIVFSRKNNQDILRDATNKLALQKMCETEKNLENSSLARLKGLRELHLNGCKKISDLSLQFAVKFLELQKLHLQDCPRITSNGLKFIGEQNPSLEEINLSQCIYISNEGILNLVRPLRRLKTLNLEGCKGLTDDCIKPIIEHCSVLKNLNLKRYGSQLSHKFDLLSLQIPSIQSLALTSEEDVLKSEFSPKPPPYIFPF